MGRGGRGGGELRSPHGSEWRGRGSVEEPTWIRVEGAGEC